MEIKITNSNIKEVLSSDKPVLIDFWATWCGPCRALAPTITAIAAEYEGKAVVAKCDVDECADIAEEYGIRNIPTLLFFKNGELVDRLVGNNPKPVITAKIDSLI
ncbi:MAG: thioredoxin [Bacteroidales bacterium]|nr:thioredoxin [Bacteroidales bacterium]